MSNIVEKIKNISDMTAMEGCSLKNIREAENALDLTFPKEYIDYVKAFGCIDFGSTEWTGLNVKGRLNTVTATKKEKEINKDFPMGYFVLENLGIDGQIIIVNEEGQVFLLQYDKKTLLNQSISDYLDLCIENNQ
ncbi:MAG: SMI1/KNR4 family protein [Carnobacterium sp.]|nr:SMI1/KNR4 family protein [Carnobacterium sp.]